MVERRLLIHLSRTSEVWLKSNRLSGSPCYKFDQKAPLKALIKIMARKCSYVCVVLGVL